MIGCQIHCCGSRGVILTRARGSHRRQRHHLLHASRIQLVLVAPPSSIGNLIRTPSSGPRPRAVTVSLPPTPSTTSSSTTWPVRTSAGASSPRGRRLSPRSPHVAALRRGEQCLSRQRRGDITIDPTLPNTRTRIIMRSRTPSPRLLQRLRRQLRPRHSRRPCGYARGARTSATATRTLASASSHRGTRSSPTTC